MPLYRRRVAHPCRQLGGRHQLRQLNPAHGSHWSCSARSWADRHVLLFNHPALTMPPYKAVLGMVHPHLSPPSEVSACHLVPSGMSLSAVVFGHGWRKSLVFNLLIAIARSAVMKNLLNEPVIRRLITPSLGRHLGGCHPLSLLDPVDGSLGRCSAPSLAPRHVLPSSSRLRPAPPLKGGA